MIYYSNLRKDLLVHHIISLVATFTFWNKIYLIHLSMLLEAYICLIAFELFILIKR